MKKKREEEAKKRQGKALKKNCIFVARSGV
jgi:hypothetical protein